MTRTKAKPAPPKRFVDDDVLIEFFERLSETEGPSRKRLQFIMAVLLLRKRLLRESKRTKRDGQSFWTVEVRRTGKCHDVVDERLSPDEIADVLSEIALVLNVDLENPDEEDKEPEP